MAELHPSSVNTLRVHTICFDGRVTVFHPYVRVGRGNSIVDNAGSGGVFTSLNPLNGEILTAMDERGHQFTKHPDNNFPLVGFKIPMWKEANEFAIQLAKQLDDVHYAGWDLALTSDGWVIVEGNPRAQLLFQISEQKGFRKELNEILSSYGKNLTW